VGWVNLMTVDMIERWSTGSWKAGLGRGYGHGHGHGHGY